ncbi:hypothetical protein F8M41_022374 [Gigaspora margarita]|uniref:Apple domain-containing protein n=1 Tax=Gigaspora margarita TaxID=4874 RepID=A0A8H4B157_GIGMA|nr:hypothetical protein F8M41_022374 [Gigaspora margarita]
MNSQAFNLFLIILFSSLLALTITVNARINHKPAHINKHNNKFAHFNKYNDKFANFNKHINDNPSHFNKHINDKPSHKQSICTTTKISTNTITITKSCGTVLTPTPTSYNNNNNCDGCKTKKTITITPTITTCVTPTPTCCQSRGSPGWDDSFNIGNGGGIYAKPYFNISTPQECCMLCINDSGCIEWLYNSPNFTNGCSLTYGNNACSNVSSTFNPSQNVGTEGGVVHCTGGSNCS